MNKKEQEKLITEIMDADAKDGLYDHIVDTNKMVTMKLYTEEQVTKLTSAAFVAGQNHNTFIFGEEFKNITPIELPSDEEMAIFALNISETLRDKLNGEQEAFFIAGFIESNKWMRDKILNK